MITIAVLDDESMYLEKEKNITEAYFRKKGIECRVEPFQSSEWLVKGIEEERFDIYVLDIEMPYWSGLDVARKIRKAYPDPIIIFVTNYTDYAVDAYEVNTWRYIPKAVMGEKLPAAYDALLPGLLEKEQKYYIIEKKGVVEKIYFDHIFCLKKDGRYTVIVHKNGESRVRASMADIYQELNSPEFLIIGKGFIVNIKHIMGLKDHTVCLRNGTRFPVGEHKLGEVRNSIAEYWRV